MGAIRVRPETGLLYFDFQYQGLRCREQSTLRDTKTNRRRLRAIMQRIDAEILLGIFEYQKYFPNSSMLEKIVPEELYDQHESIPSFHAFSKIWLEEMRGQWRPTHYRGTLAKLDRHIYPRFAKRRVDRITKSDVLRFRSDLVASGRMGNSQINHVINPLSMILSEAADRYGFINPVSDLKGLRVEKTEVDPFSLHEVNLILNTIREDFRPYLTVRFFTGLRPAEINGLQWDNIDFERKLIMVRHAYVQRELIWTKTPGSVRDIVMDPLVEKALRQQKRMNRKNSSFVFCTYNGHPVDGDNFRKRIWKPLLKFLNIKPRTPYATRHTAATLWLASGESPEFIARQMGHTSTEMLFKTYSRFVPNLTRQDGTAMSSLLDQSIQIEGLTDQERAESDDSSTAEEGSNHG
jgi:integrase